MRTSIQLKNPNEKPKAMIFIYILIVLLDAGLVAAGVIALIKIDAGNTILLLLIAAAVIFVAAAVDYFILYLARHLRATIKIENNITICVCGRRIQLSELKVSSYGVRVTEKTGRINDSTTYKSCMTVKYTCPKCHKSLEFTSEMLPSGNEIEVIVNKKSSNYLPTGDALEKTRLEKWYNRDRDAMKEYKGWTPTGVWEIDNSQPK